MVKTSRSRTLSLSASSSDSSHSPPNCGCGKKDRLPNVDSRRRMNNSSALRSRSSSQESHGEESHSVTLTSLKQVRNNVSPPTGRSSSQQPRGGRDRSVTSRGPQRCSQTQSSQLSARKISSGTGSVQQQPSICSSPPTIIWAWRPLNESYS